MQQLVDQHHELAQMSCVQSTVLTQMRSCAKKTRTASDAHVLVAERSVERDGSLTDAVFLFERTL